VTKKNMLCAAIIAAAITACARTSGQARVAEPDFSAERMKAHVAFLADDLLEGREAGTRGHEIAARYVAAQFALLGLKPGGRDGGYFETVDLLEAAQTKPTPTLILTTPHGKHTWEQAGSVMLRGPMADGVIKLNAPLVFVGYGMKDAALGYDDYAGLDVRGKIAVVLFGSPKGMDSEIGAHLQSEQSRVAAEHGAVAIVAVATRATAAAVPWEKVIEFLGAPPTTWVRKDGTPFDPLYGLKAAAAADPKAAPSLFDGAPETLAHILDEADKPGGRPKGFALTATAQIAVATTVRRFSSPDVIGVIEGSDSKLKNEYVALMGHADHIGVKTGGTGDRINNGALDNGAGVATLIEVAHALATAAQRPRRSILVVANTAEEKGLLGAEYFAHYPTVPIERVTAAIDLDMPMLLYDFTDVVAYGASHSTLGSVFQDAGAAMGVKLSPDPMPEQAIFVRSDHYAMVKVGVPAVMLATGMANGGDAAWAKYLANNYHQPSDDLSQPILWSAGAKFAELNYRVVRVLADAEAGPQWYAKDYFGDLFAAKAPKTTKLPGR
jgi:Zn-dependent M28 family amino/carboxypeptidase